MYKEIEAGSWDSFADQGIGHIVPMSSRGLTQADGHRFFQKTAASEKFLHEMREVKLADGEMPIHINAIGAYEVYGGNRKGDAFSEQTLRDYHSTFATDGKFYAHHRNRDPKINFGKIASACYNDKMHRVELLVIANTNSKAAKKNAGLVLPNEFLEKLEKNAEIAVSMGCSISRDICANFCRNSARTTAEYCDETNCRDPKTGEWGFGCKNGLAKVAESGKVQCVDNIAPTFFDISAVGIPADRTAYGFVADYLPSTRKTASLEKSAEDYLNVTASATVPLTYTQRMKARLQKLAAIETAFNQNTDADIFLGYGFYAAPSDISLGQKIAGMLPEEKFPALSRLSQHGLLLSPEAFALAMGMDKSAGTDIRCSSKNIYRDTYDRYTNTSLALPATLLSKLAAISQSKLAEWYLPVHSLTPHQMDRAKTAALVRQGVFTHMNQSAPIEVRQFRDLAESYALYKAAALCCFPAALQEFGEKAAILQTVSLPDSVG